MKSALINPSGSIKQLSPELIRLIAAGEVVQHPTSAVKELIENALDAGATAIEVFATGAGYATLGVIDNGHGMSAPDLALSWQSHATSKLLSLDDLTQIASFGFRGEALYSLATMSRLEIRSRQPEAEMAHTIVIEHGQLVSGPTASAGRTGTKVTAHALFAGVPGRRPRSAKIETRELLKLVSAMSLIFPEVSWKLSIDQHSWTWPSTTGLIDRASSHWGASSSDELWPVLGKIPGGEVQGVLAHPKQARRQSQSVVSVNGRWVEWPALQQAVKDAFGTLLEAPMHPSWVLSFTLAPESLDPNIHPNKKEVRLFEEAEILRQLVPLLQQGLQEHFLRTQKEVLWRVSESSPEQAAGKAMRQLAELPTLEAERQEIAQLNRLYLVTSTPEGLLLIDQHAAHERVLYEEFVQVWQEAERAPESVSLEPAVNFPVSAQDDLVLQESGEILARLGWEVESFGERRWVVRAIPARLADRDVASLLRGTLDDLEAGLISPSLHPHHHRLLATLACRSAIKAGQELSPAARKELLRQLAETTTNFACPHGRPVSTLIPWREVENWFHR